jgi:hypothetical protein
MEIITQRYGAMPAKAPNLAVSFEIVLYWTGAQENVAQLVRACAAALAICIDRPPLPKYKPAMHKPDNFGHDALDKLLQLGETSETIFAQGTKCLQFLSDQLPGDKETEEAKDFLDTPQPDDTQD